MSTITTVRPIQSYAMVAKSQPAKAQGAAKVATTGVSGTVGAVGGAVGGGFAWAALGKALYGSQWIKALPNWLAIVGIVAIVGGAVGGGWMTGKLGAMLGDKIEGKK